MPCQHIARISIWSVATAPTACGIETPFALMDLAAEPSIVATAPTACGIETNALHDVLRLQL